MMEIRFNQSLTSACLCSPDGGDMLGTEHRKEEVRRMLVDLEELLYGGEDAAVSER